MFNVKQFDFAIIGLAVMGENLALNIAGRGFSVCVYNRTAEKTERFLAGRASGVDIGGAFSLDELMSRLCRPRRIMLMVKAGQPVDDILKRLFKIADQGDIIIDGGNSDFADTERRAAAARSHGLYYLGCGVSGGELGALRGPAMMPGGDIEAWRAVEPVFTAACARASDGEPCCRYIGTGGAGHFVKTVHNGIEYGDMQLICEIYQLMRDLLGMSDGEAGEVFGEWNRGELSSYLIEITRDILLHRESDGTATVEKILDTAGQKGTGRNTVMAALTEGVPLTLIAEAVFARQISARRDERLRLGGIYGNSRPVFAGDRTSMLTDLRSALYASKIISYAQGFSLLGAASRTYGWKLDLPGIALIWRGGCIIRSVFLDRISKSENCECLLADPGFAATVKAALPGLRRICAQGALSGIPLPATSAALSWFDSVSCTSLPANLLQAQRDYFGAHTYERVDRPRGEFFHTDWTGEGGATLSGTYTV